MVAQWCWNVFKDVRRCFPVFKEGENEKSVAALSTYAQGDMVAQFGREYRNNTSRDFFDAYLEAIQNNKRMDGRVEKEGDVSRIVVFDNENKQIGKVIVDNFSDFGEYYLKKLNLFDSFWFYITIKDTVTWNVRRRSREMFHADVLFTGLF